MASYWSQWHPRSPASRLFTELFIQVQIQENINAPRYRPLVRGIHQWPVNSPHKGPVMWKIFPYDDVIMFSGISTRKSLYETEKKYETAWGKYHLCCISSLSHYFDVVVWVLWRVFRYKCTLQATNNIWNIKWTCAQNAWSFLLSYICQISFRLTWWMNNYPYINLWDTITHPINGLVSGKLST